MRPFPSANVRHSSFKMRRRIRKREVTSNRNHVIISKGVIRQRFFSPKVLKGLEFFRLAGSAAWYPVQATARFQNIAGSKVTETQRIRTVLMEQTPDEIIDT